MERKLGSIRRIENLSPIEGADRIEVATIGGWKVVVNKDIYKINDLCIYFEIDSILPDCETFAFLRDSNFRIKTRKMRKQISQGICFPLSICQEFGYIGFDEPGNCMTVIKTEDHINNIDASDRKFFIVEDADVTELFDVEKYEPNISGQNGSFERRGNFPIEVPKTDEERIQNLGKRYFERFGEEKIQFVLTEKLDGQSFSAININDEFQVCSRNMSLTENEDNLFWKSAIKYGLKEKLKGRNIALQGEQLGPGIQGNKYKLVDTIVRFFSAFDIDTQKYLPHEAFISLIKELNLDTVPVIGYHVFDGPLSPEDMEKFIKSADGKSLLNDSVMREGIVFKSANEVFNSHHGKISFKIISNAFLLKHE